MTNELPDDPDFVERIAREILGHTRLSDRTIVENEGRERITFNVVDGVTYRQQSNASAGAVPMSTFNEVIDKIKSGHGRASNEVACESNVIRFGLNWHEHVNSSETRVVSEPNSLPVYPYFEYEPPLYIDGFLGGPDRTLICSEIVRNIKYEVFSTVTRNMENRVTYVTVNLLWCTDGIVAPMFSTEVTGVFPHSFGGPNDIVGSFYVRMQELGRLVATAHNRVAAWLDISWQERFINFWNDTFVVSMESEYFSAINTNYGRFYTEGAYSLMNRPGNPTVNNWLPLFSISGFGWRSGATMLCDREQNSMLSDQTSGLVFPQHNLINDDVQTNELRNDNERVFDPMRRPNRRLSKEE